MNRRQFLNRIGVSAALFVPTVEALALTRPNPSQEELWTRPREIWITRPDSQESGRFVYWADGNVIDDQYWALCKIMRDLHADKSVAMHIGLLNFQYAIQQGINFYFGEAPYILTDGFRTGKTNASIENSAKNSQHLEASANDGHYEKPSIEDLFKLASWFGVGGVGIYPRHVHVDAYKTRRWAGTYGSGKRGHK
jgi:uncharacterized protein YcbK (DUF882 family)